MTLYEFLFFISIWCLLLLYCIMAASQTIYLFAEEVVIKAAIISIIMYCIAKMTCNLISGKLERAGSPELS